MSSSEIIVGIHAVEALLRSNPKQISQLLCSESRHDKRHQKLLTLAGNQGVNVEKTNRSQLRDICGHDKHQGIIAYFAGSLEKTEAHLLTDLKARDRPWLVLALDGIQDPHNLGACLRSADGFAVDAVIVPRDNAASVTPVVQKVAAGAAATVPFYRVTNLSRVLRQLQDNEAWVYGAAGESEQSLYETEFSGSVVLVLGAEGAGLRQNTRQSCDQLYKIPLSGSVSSLNVSVATGISLNEVARQRHFVEKN